MHFTEMILGYEHEFKSVLAIQLYLVMAVLAIFISQMIMISKNIFLLVRTDMFVQLNISCSEICIMQLHNVKILEIRILIRFIKFFKIHLHILKRGTNNSIFGYFNQDA